MKPEGQPIAKLEKAPRSLGSVQAEGLSPSPAPPVTGCRPQPAPRPVPLRRPPRGQRDIPTFPHCSLLYLCPILQTTITETKHILLWRVYIRVVAVWGRKHDENKRYLQDFSPRMDPPYAAWHTFQSRGGTFPADQYFGTTMHGGLSWDIRNGIFSWYYAFSFSVSALKYNPPPPPTHTHRLKKKKKKLMNN